ncbi:putative membrane protein [Acetivibrio clariflavus DSM 19732]|uniref:Putative membrane protein n=1 Tax=Acetivibrio clariflavus (strain DSM 19732 / NBRC 101661 / EBR45) TaxID=720554 RepID=G8LSR1_ACECE|nr:putative membrane protein [Acetivibrio clariflavus DSM 19732]
MQKNRKDDSVLVVFARTLILFTLVVVTMRIMGKRQIGELQPFELAVAILISELAAVPMQNTGIPLVNGIIPILTLLIAQMSLSLISLKSVKARGIICGKPSILIANGKIQEDELRKEMFTLNDLLEQLRINNTPNIADVEFAILETNGQLSVIPKSQKRTVTAEDLNISTNYEGLPLALIIDGSVNYQNLQKANLDLPWLLNEIRKFGAEKPEDVLFASLDTQGNLYCQTKSSKRGK